MDCASLKFFKFSALLLQQGWMCPAYAGVDNTGTIRYLSHDAPKEPVAIEPVLGFALPGFQNAHSHAFQYAMAGMAEKHPAGSNDDFWSWREAMYECALSMEPDELESIAAMLYAQMLRTGYTHVAEFHYLHHDRNGKPYANLAELGERLIAAAETAGIKITLVPVFYQTGNFGKPYQPRQHRFISETPDDYFKLLDASTKAVSAYKDAKLGFGVHSLRAVNHHDIFKTIEYGPRNLPFHLHAAEQLKEVDDCIAYLKQRPVEWLLDHLPVNERFHIVHCTHMNDQEVKGLAQSGANAILCPGTEGNLGDGIFRLTDFARFYGNWSIGTDSHISLNPLEDLRWLDYAQRFTTHKRNTFDDGATVLINKTILCGRGAMGLSKYNFFEIGQPLDAVVYDAKTPLLSQLSHDHVLPAIVYTADSSAVFGTLVNGQWMVKNQRHRDEDRIRKGFKRASKTLLDQ
jgi:formimidoylglutamate deiminase